MMSRRSLPTTTLILLTAGLVAGLTAPEAGAVEVDDAVPFAEAEPVVIRYPAGTLDTPIPIELRVLDQGGMKSYEGECRAKRISQSSPVRRLVCPGLGSAALELVEQSSERVSLAVDLRDFQLAPSMAGDLQGAVLGGDKPLVNEVRVQNHWFWGVICIAEASDSTNCSSLCSGIGAAGSEVDTVADHVNGKCLAVCTCLDANGNSKGSIVIDSAPF